MRTTQLITQYIQALLFAAIGLRTVRGWLRTRDRKQAHLAVATVLFAANSLIGAINTTLYNSALGQQPPRLDSIISGAVLLSSVFAFILFLTDFIPTPRWLVSTAAAITVIVIVGNAIERPDLRFDPTKGIVHIAGVHNFIGYRTWIGFLLGVLVVAFGILWLAFFVFGLRVHGLARFRMMSIAGGFFLLFVVIGLLPRLLFGNPSAKTIRDLVNVLSYVALGTAPLLFLGFAPPKWVTRRFNGNLSN